MTMLTQLMAAERQRELVRAARASRRPESSRGARRLRRLGAGRGAEVAIAARRLEQRSSC
jgi:hypothetical protein